MTPTEAPEVDPRVDILAEEMASTWSSSVVRDTERAAARRILDRLDAAVTP